MSLRMKIITLISVVLIVGFTILISITTILMDNESERISTDFLKSQALVQQRTALAMVTSAQITGRGLTEAIESLLETSRVKRDNLGIFAKNYLEEAPEVLGFTVVLEPDVLGFDSDNVKLGYSDKNGRFTPYFFRDGNSIKWRAARIDDPAANEWYGVAKRTGKTHLTKPYSWEANGRTVFGMSVSDPIVDRKGKVLGAVVTDIDLMKMGRILSKGLMFQTGDLGVFNDSNQWVFHTKANLIAKKLSGERQKLFADFVEEERIFETENRINRCTSF